MSLGDVLARENLGPCPDCVDLRAKVAELEAWMDDKHSEVIGNTEKWPALWQKALGVSAAVKLKMHDLGLCGLREGGDDE